jgi:hypothetical protein
MITRNGVYCLSAAAEGFLVPIGFAGAVLAVIDISARPEYNASMERMMNAAPRAEILHFGACPLAALKKIKFEKENLMAKDLTQQTWHGVPRKKNTVVSNCGLRRLYRMRFVLSDLWKRCL